MYTRYFGNVLFVSYQQHDSYYTISIAFFTHSSSPIPHPFLTHSSSILPHPFFLIHSSSSTLPHLSHVVPLIAYPHLFTLSPPLSISYKKLNGPSTTHSTSLLDPNCPVETTPCTRLISRTIHSNMLLALSCSIIMW